MRQLRKSTAAGVLGSAALLLLASPSFAAGDHSGTTAGGPIQLAHMEQGAASQWTGQPCPMGMMGAGMGGQGMLAPGMMGPGMMGPGFGMGPGLGGQFVARQDLTADDVRHFLQHRLEMQGNARLTVGEVTEADDDKIVAEITTVDGSLVQRFEVDRHTGQMQQVE